MIPIQHNQRSYAYRRVAAVLWLVLTIGIGLDFVNYVRRHKITLR